MDEEINDLVQQTLDVLSDEDRDDLTALGFIRWLQDQLARAERRLLDELNLEEIDNDSTSIQ